MHEHHLVILCLGWTDKPLPPTTYILLLDTHARLPFFHYDSTTHKYAQTKPKYSFLWPLAMPLQRPRHTFWTMQQLARAPQLAKHQYPLSTLPHCSSTKLPSGTCTTNKDGAKQRLSPCDPVYVNSSLHQQRRVRQLPLGAVPSKPCRMRTLSQKLHANSKGASASAAAHMLHSKLELCTYKPQLCAGAGQCKDCNVPERHSVVDAQQSRAQASIREPMRTAAALQSSHSAKGAVESLLQFAERALKRWLA